MKSQHKKKHNFLGFGMRNSKLSVGRRMGKMAGHLGKVDGRINEKFYFAQVRFKRPNRYGDVKGVVYIRSH